MPTCIEHADNSLTASGGCSAVPVVIYLHFRQIIAYARTYISHILLTILHITALTTAWLSK